MTPQTSPGALRPRSGRLRMTAMTLLMTVSAVALAPPALGGVALAASSSQSKAKRARAARCVEGSKTTGVTYNQYLLCLKDGRVRKPVKAATKTITKTVPGPTQTVPGPTQTVPGPTQTVPGPTQTVTGPTTTVTQPPPPPPPAKQAKNIILMIGDGMGVTHIDAARQRYYGAAGALNMEKFPTLGTVSTYAVEPGSATPNYVTDSASAATAWSSGVKTYNNALGKDAFGKTVPTIMEEAKAAGMRTGNVSNAELTDATPGGQFSHVSLRGCQGPTFTTAACVVNGGPLNGQGAGDKTVADQIASNGTADVILGGGLARFEPANEVEMKASGYQVLGSFGDPSLSVQTPTSQTVPTKSDLAGVSGRDKKVIGVFNRANMTVEKFKRENPESVQAQEPSVGEMTDKAISLLENSDQGEKNGFFLQVEGALIDKRSHANDAAQTLEEMKAFDDAVKKARDFAEADGNTLVIVTADHECAGFSIIEKSTFTNAEANVPPLNKDTTGVGGQTGTTGRGGADFTNAGNDSTPARPGNNVRDLGRSPAVGATGASGTTGPVFPVNRPGASPSTFAPATFRTADDPTGVTDGSTAASLWLSYLSGNHTGADVKIFAFGPQSDRFDQHIDNTDIYGKMKASLSALK